MNTGKLLVGAIVIPAVIAGAMMYYLQVYAYYEPVPAETPLTLTVIATGQPEPILTENFEGIDANSSPIRFRACFTTAQSIAMLTATYQTYPDPSPLTGPGWFDCYDAKTITEALETGRATAFLGEKNIHYGVDRVIAIFDDGRAYAWHQLNNCGETAYDG
ncbi:MAG: DUF6446 family protein, partial [Paracoccaceae bacterium]